MFCCAVRGSFPFPAFSLVHCHGCFSLVQMRHFHLPTRRGAESGTEWEVGSSPGLTGQSGCPGRGAAGCCLKPQLQPSREAPCCHEGQVACPALLGTAHTGQVAWRALLGTLHTGQAAWLALRPSCGSSHGRWVMAPGLSCAEVPLLYE